MRSSLCLLIFAAWSTLVGAVAPELLQGLNWRLIGPFRGGRAIAVSGVPGDGRTFYFGAVGGGIWKTADAGNTWTPIFDGEPIASIGAIEVAPSNPDVIYAGSGEPDMRSDITFGDGMYKSSDGGKTWKNVGIGHSMQIGRIAVHPRNPDVVYVAVLGHGYGPNEERGVYRTTNGGSTWKKVLDKGPDVGAIDLALDPEHPKSIYASMWQARRTAWSQYPPQGGPGSGLYKTTDGGDHWTQLTGNGLPDGEWGRAGLVVARGGKRVYALIEAKSGGLFRSDDSGARWTRVSDDSRLTSRAWYFSSLTVDPNHPDIIYVPNVALYRSIDGGKNFAVVRGAPGGDDYHQIWIDSMNSDRMVLGTDQGTTISVNGGATWTTWYNQPTAQFYHVITDNQFPYVVYGSQQDSGTAAVPSRTDHGEISERDWSSVGGGESGYIAPDPRDPNLVYVNGTYGSLNRFDKRTGQSQNIAPWPAFSFGSDISQRKYRFTWTSPLIFSPLDQGTLYYGAQVLLKTTDGGLQWQEISPDLTGDTRKDKSAKPEGPPTAANAKERGYGVIYTIAPSAVEAKEIWTGSDTGLVHLTRDGGKSWANVTPPGLADWSKIALIEASHYDAGTAYAAIDRHRLDDYKPYLFRTHDYGKTWIPITAGLNEPAYLNAVREDPLRKGLLFAGTELGVYVSFDDGDNWQSLQLNLPVSSVRDLVIHGDDLVVATHGRSFWILDDISPLRQITPEVGAAEVWLGKPAEAIRQNHDGFPGTPLPPEFPQGRNPPNGAILDFYLKTPPLDEIELDILDDSSKLVRHYSSKPVREEVRRKAPIADRWLLPPAGLTKKAGMNRFVWDLRYPPPGKTDNEEAEFSGFGGGPQALPGSYQVRLTVGGKSYTQPLAVKLDPRSAATQTELAEQLELGLRASTEIQRTAAALKKLQGDKTNSEIVGSLKAVNDELVAVLGVVESADRKPPAQAYALFEDASKKLNALIHQ